MVSTVLGQYYLLFTCNHQHMKRTKQLLVVLLIIVLTYATCTGFIYLISGAEWDIKLSMRVAIPFTLIAGILIVFFLEEDIKGIK